LPYASEFVIACHSKPRNSPLSGGLLVQDSVPQRKG
jgi:hypothetical protein